jgi:hypothetical protein
MGPLDLVFRQSTLAEPCGSLMIYFLIFLIGCVATGCTLTGAVLIGIQEEQDFTDRREASEVKKSERLSERL